MSKYIYATTVRQTEDGKLYAEAVRMPSSTNLVGLKEITDLVIFQIMPSRADAIKTAVNWQDGFIANGTSLFKINYCGYIYDWSL